MSDITRFSAQKWLTVVWFIGTGFLSFIVAVWLFTGRLQQMDEVVTWLLQNVAPYISLITTTFIVGYTRTNRSNDEEIDRFFYRLSMTLTIFYFLLLTGILISLPYSKFYNISTPEETFKASNKVLPYIQGVVTGVLGVFFVKKK